MNRSEWASGFLAYAGWPVSQEKVVALVAQATAEGSTALNNPLDTTEPAPGATDYNRVGVKNYPSLDAGYAATLATFSNGRYPQLVAVLSDPAGGSATTYATSAELTVWGTGSCLGIVEEIKGGDPHGYLSAPVHTSGEGGSAPLPSPANPPTTQEEAVPLSAVVSYRPDQVDLFEVTGGALLHKFATTPGEWNAENLVEAVPGLGLRPSFGDQEPQVSVLAGQVYVAVLDTTNRPWVFSQGPTGSWGVTELP